MTGGRLRGGGAPLGATRSLRTCLTRARDLPAHFGAALDVTDPLAELRIVGTDERRVCHTEVAANAGANAEFKFGCCTFDDVAADAFLEVRVVESDLVRSQPIGVARAAVANMSFSPAAAQWLALSPGPGEVLVSATASEPSPMPPPAPPMEAPAPPPPPLASTARLRGLRLIDPVGDGDSLPLGASLQPSFRPGRTVYTAVVGQRVAALRVGVGIARGAGRVALRISGCANVSWPGGGPPSSIAKERSSARREHRQDRDDEAMLVFDAVTLCPSGEPTLLGVLVKSRDGSSERMYAIRVRRAAASADGDDAGLEDLRVALEAMAPTAEPITQDICLTPAFSATAGADGEQCGIIPCAPPTEQQASLRPRHSLTGSWGAAGGEGLSAAGAETRFLTSHAVFEVAVPAGGSRGAHLRACVRPRARAAAVCVLEGWHAAPGPAATAEDTAPWTWEAMPGSPCSRAALTGVDSEVEGTTPQDGGWREEAKGHMDVCAVLPLGAQVYDPETGWGPDRRPRALRFVITAPDRATRMAYTLLPVVASQASNSTAALSGGIMEVGSTQALMVVAMVSVMSLVGQLVLGGERGAAEMA